MKFVNLHAHTTFSIADGLNYPKEHFEFVIENAESDSMAMAITDHGNANAFGYAFQAQSELRKKGVPFKFLPGCLLRGQEIITRQGVKNIEEIKVGDEVLTHKGRFRKVVNTSVRPYKGKLYSIYLNNRYSRPISVTEEHPVLIRDFGGEMKWVLAKDLCGGRKFTPGAAQKRSVKSLQNWNSYVCVPKINTDSLQEYVDILSFVSDEFVEKDGYICKNNSLLNEKYNRLFEWKNVHNKQKVDSEFAYFLGLFCAEGHTCADGRFGFTFNISEENYASFVKSFLKKRFSLEAQEYKRVDKNTINIESCCRPLSSFLRAVCGYDCYNKKVPSFIFDQSSDIIRSFIDGLIDGDGKTKAKNSSKQDLKVSSRNLAWGLRALLTNFGIFNSISEYNYDDRKSYQVCVDFEAYHRVIQDESYVFRPLKEVRSLEFDGNVYNCEVEEDNSYVSDIILHNCEFYYHPDLDAWAKLKEKKDAGQELSEEDDDTGLVIEIEDESKSKWYDPIKRRHHLVVVAYNRIGLTNLYRLISRSYRYGFYRYPRIDNKMLAEFSEGLVISSACLAGIPSWSILQDETRSLGAHFDVLDKEVKPLLDIFPKGLAHLEIQFNNLREQKIINDVLIEYAQSRGYPLLATADSHYCRPEYWRERELYRMLGWQSKGMKTSFEDLPESIDDLKCQLYPKNGQEMFDEYKKMYDGGDSRLDQIVKDAIYRGWEIGHDLCEDLSPDASMKLPKRTKDNKTSYEQLEDLCLEALVAKGLNKKSEYVARLEMELGIIKKKEFSDYFTTLYDAMTEIKKHQLSSPGRGCLDGTKNILTPEGYVPLKDIKEGDFVFNVSGKKTRVNKKFKYRVNEKLLSIKTTYSFEPLVLTKDHKLYGKKGQNDLCSWASADSFSTGEQLYSPFPKNIKEWDLDELDLSLFAFDERFSIEDNKIKWTTPKSNKFSIRKLNKETQISRNCLSFIKRNGVLPKTHKPYPTRHFSSVKILNKTLNEYGVSINEWRLNKNLNNFECNRFLKFDEDFCYFLGRWIGDGWYKCSSRKSFVAIAFNSTDQDGIKWFENFASKFGTTVSWNHSKTKLLSRGYIYSKILARIIWFMFPEYKNKSNTKYLGSLSRLVNKKLFSVINGLVDSDGYVENGKRCIERINIDTTSKRLAMELKFSLLKLKIPSAISTRKPYGRGKYSCKESYKVRFKYQNKKISNDGFFCRILSIEEVDSNKFVYDLSVEDGHPSYTTENCVVHNTGAGSLILYLLDITQLDPIKNGLLFERFLSEDRSEPPDVDLDSQDRDACIQILRQLFGETEVVPITNYNTLQLKSLVKDISKLYEIPFSDVNDVTKVMEEEARQPILDEIGGDQKLYDFNYENALKHSPSFAKFIDNYPYVGEHIGVLYKQIKSIGRHAGGVAITNCSEEAMPVIKVRGEDQTPWSEGLTAKHLEPAGVIKYDFLGLATLRFIQRAIELILKKRTGKNPSFEDINKFYSENLHPDVVEDGEFEVFQEVYQKGRFPGIFQFTEKNAQKFCATAKPERVMDLSVITSLYRPGPIKGGADKKYVELVENPEDIHFDHPILEDVLGETKGLLAYQEQFMLLANKLAGFSLKEANNLRKLLVKPVTSMGEEMKKQRKEVGQKFIQGCINQGLSESRAISLWEDEILGFISYGFCKSHALAYAYVSYQCAWLFHHYPDEWICAYLENDPDRDKAISDVSSVGYVIGKPDIMKSTSDWTVHGNNELVPSFGTIKGIGDSAVDEIIEIRSRWQKPDSDTFGKEYFRDLFESFFYDFVEVQMKKGTKIKKKWKFSKFNKRALEALIKCEALDELGFVGEGRLFENYAHMHRVLIDNWSKREQARFDVLALAAAANKNDWSDGEKIEFQSELIGTFDKNLLFTEEEMRMLEEVEIFPLDHLSTEPRSIWFILKDFAIRKTKNNKAYYRLFIQDIVGKEKTLNYFSYVNKPFKRNGVYCADLYLNGSWINVKGGIERIK